MSLPSREELIGVQCAVADFAQRAAVAGPTSGWDAGQICAHLLLNNGLFIRTAQQVAAGESTTYDNEASIDDAANAALAAGAGSIGVLSEWLRQSVNAYVDLLTSLPEDVLDTTVTTTIRSGENYIADHSPMRLGDLMLGQLTFHAQMHLEQVRALAEGN